MLPKILRNFNVFVDGRGYAGKIDEVTLPKLTIKTEEYRAGGMDIPISIDMGMEKLEADFTFSEYDTELFRLFGLINGNSVALTLRGGMQGSGSNDIEAVIINLRGIFKEFDFGSWKPAEKATLKCTVAAHYYKLTIGGNELIEIDAENMMRKINGIDQINYVFLNFLNLVLLQLLFITLYFYSIKKCIFGNKNPSLLQKEIYIKQLPLLRPYG